MVFPKISSTKSLQQKKTKSTINTYSTRNETRQTPPHIQNYTSLTYIKGVTEKIEKIVKTHNPLTKIAHKSTNLLRSVFTKLKDQTPQNKMTHVIYKIPCLGSGKGDCDLSYVGQTKQYLENRLQNHRRDLRVGNLSLPKTALVDHCLSQGHYPDFRNTKIIDSEQRYSKRLTLEALHIYTEHTMNIKQDTDHISSVYSAILDEKTRLKRKQISSNSDTFGPPRKRIKI